MDSPWGFLYLYVMAIIDPYLKNLDRIEKQLEQIGQRAVKENVEYILYVITEEQWALGQNSQGSIIGTYKWTTEKLSKDPWNKPKREKVKGQPYNLNWTGQLFESLSLRAEQDSFSIFSTTGKIQFLEKELKTTLSKLTPANNKKINDEIIMPALQKHILDNLFVV